MSNHKIYRPIVPSLAMVAIATVLLVGIIPGCFPIAPERDTGDESFVRQVVPVLHGRKIRGYDEVKVLSDIIGLTNREVIVRALMEQPEFVDHWAEVVVGDLRVHREGIKSQVGCYSDPLRSSDSPALAQFIRQLFTPSSTAPGGAFNMSDVVRSAIVADNLYPVTRAHLFAMQSEPISAFNPEQTRRDDLGATFGHVFLHRELGCLVCHNSDSSLSGETSGWDRTYPILGSFEAALYGSPEGEPPQDAFAMFRTDVTTGSNLTEPWGIQSCGSFKESLSVDDPLDINAHFIGYQGKRFGIWNLQYILEFGYIDLIVDGLERTLPPELQAACNFCADNCTGNEPSVSQIANNAVNASAVKNILTNIQWAGSSNNRCRDCHSGSAGLYISNDANWANNLIDRPASEKMSLKRVKPGQASNSYLIHKLEGMPAIVGAQMPPGDSLSAPQINTVKAWINDLPELSACEACDTYDCSQIRKTIKGHEAFAFLVAANVVNNVWDEVLGSPVTIDNYFPRNSSQLGVLWNLTEFNFIPNDWSLKELLVRILTSNFFNRTAPLLSTGSTAYEIPPAFDPWIVADPRVPPASDSGYVPANHPENHKNAVGEGVHRYSARNLFSSVHKALDWPAPQRFAPITGYPDRDLQKAIGQYFSDIEPGFESVDFQALLTWEATHGVCANPTSADDWVDRLMTSINNFPTAGGPLRVEDVVATMRDWLLSDGTIATSNPVNLTMSEEDALEALFGVSNLNRPVNSVANLETKLRGLCGVLLESPQFLLAGLAPSGLGPEPRLRVCNDGTCTYQEICLAIKPAVDQNQPGPEQLVCLADSVQLIPVLDEPPYVVVDIFCPNGICGILTGLLDLGCLIDPPPPNVLMRSLGFESRTTAREDFPRFLDLTACDTKPPACDPRCATIDCCGGPLPPLDRRRINDLHVAWADNALVRVAEGVKVRRPGSEKYVVLKEGERLHVGDLIAVPPGARFELAGKEGVIRTDWKTPETERATPQFTRYMIITGDAAVREQRVAPEGMKRLNLTHLQMVRQSAWQHRGQAGVPLQPEDRATFRVPIEELEIEAMIERGLLPEGWKPGDRIPNKYREDHGKGK